MFRTLLFLLAFSGCAGTYGRVSHSPTLHRANQVGLAAAVLTTACDWGQTSWAMRSGGFEEQNGALGTSPSQLKLAEYMTGSIAVTAAIWWLLPEVAKPVIWGRTTGVEGDAVIHNMGEGAPLCGLPSGGPAAVTRR